MLESLESRRLLAGNVTAAINGSGVLAIAGDNKSNDVVVFTSASDTYVVGKPGTKVNGLTTPVQFAGFPTIAVTTGNGDDTVELDDLLNQSVSVDTGNGQDDVVWQTVNWPGASYTNNLTIDTGNGNDSVLVDFDGQYITGNVKIDLGNGSDKLAVAGFISIGGNADSNGGHGPDVLDLSGVTGTSIGGSVSITGYETLVI